MTDRLFLAVALDDEVRHGLAAFLDRSLDGSSIPGKPVAPENWHVTLRFLGASSPEQADRVAGFLDERLSTPPFSISFAGLGAFPEPSRVGVLWLGIDRGAAELAEIADLCEEAAVAAGFNAHDRPFHAHLTLARLRPRRDVTPLVEGFPAFPLTQPVSEVVLFRSHFGGGGARYERLGALPLP